MEKDKNPFCGPAMLEKLKGALPPNSRRRSGREGFDRFHRFVVVQQFLGAIVKKWPSIYREKYDGRERCQRSQQPRRTPSRSLGAAVRYSSPRIVYLPT